MINELILIKAAHFVLPGLVGILYAYAWKWVEEVKDKSLFNYLFGDSKAVVKVILIFLASCAGVVSLDYLAMLDTVHLMIAGFSLGLLIPQKAAGSYK